MIDFITGEKFISIADHVFSIDDQKECNYIKNTFGNKRVMQNDIIYTHTKYVGELFKEIGKLLVDVIVITHNSDTNVGYQFVVPENVKKWYTMNVICVNDKIQSIPIGLENDKWFPRIKKKEKMIEKMKERKQTKGLLYVNHNINTNPIERKKVYHVFEGKCKCWCTIEHGVNGKGFEGYIDNVYNHYFVACPEGNGIDTVRLWETLYMNTIPIVKKNINTDYYKDFPICFINNWEDVNEEFLIGEYSKIKGKTWDYNKLLFNYWKKLIQDEKYK
jgi:hypothetical protein